MKAEWGLQCIWRNPLPESNNATSFSNHVATVPSSGKNSQISSVRRDSGNRNKLKAPVTLFIHLKEVLYSGQMMVLEFGRWAWGRSTPGGNAWPIQGAHSHLRQFTTTDIYVGDRSKPEILEQIHTDRSEHANLHTRTEPGSMKLWGSNTTHCVNTMMSSVMLDYIKTTNKDSCGSYV